MNTSKRNNQKSLVIPTQPISKRRVRSTSNDPKPASSRPLAKRGPWWDARYLDEHVGHWWEGLILNWIERYGRRFLLSRYTVEVCIGSDWETIIEESREANIARALIEASRIRDGYAPDGTLRLPDNLWGGLPVRCRLQTMTISYSSALLLVRKKVLFPAIGDAIPRCMSADLYANVSTNMDGFLEGPEPPQEMRIVGASRVSIPPGFRLGKTAGVIQRK